ncbi:MAG: hypothetical protein J0L55_17615 [Caulobacterales bacterium]|nr:hypothetical protein [Caulobacterales bacterium]
MFVSSLFMLAAAVEPMDTNNDLKVQPKNQFENRGNARIAFESMIRTFAVKSEGQDDILYLDTGAGKWYRAPLTCFGMGDPRTAMQILPISHGTGIDKFTRFKLLGLGRNETNECTINDLIELLPQETVEFGLESQKNVDKRAANIAVRKSQ